MKESEFRAVFPSGTITIESKPVTGKPEEVFSLQLNPVDTVIEVGSASFCKAHESGGLSKLEMPAFMVLNSIRNYFVDQALGIYDPDQMFQFVDNFFGSSLAVNIGLGAVLYNSSTREEPRVLLGNRLLENSWSPGWVFPSETVDQADWGDYPGAISLGELFQTTLSRLILEEIADLDHFDGEVDSAQTTRFILSLIARGENLKILLKHRSYLLTSYLDISAGSLWLVPIIGIPINQGLEDFLISRIKLSKEWHREFTGDGQFYPLNQALNMVNATGPRFALQKLQSNLVGNF